MTIHDEIYILEKLDEAERSGRVWIPFEQIKKEMREKLLKQLSEKVR